MNTNAPEEAAEPAELITLEDGRIVNAETGETVGMAVPEDLLTNGAEVMTDSLADWVMSKMLRHDSRRVAAHSAIADASKRMTDMEAAALAQLHQSPEWIEAQTINSNAVAMAEKSESALDFFHNRYDRSLGDWAAMNIGSGKGRTWATPYGSIALKKVPAKVEVADAEAVTAWCKSFAPGALKVTTEFRISQLPAGMKAELISGEGSVPGLTVVPESEKVVVSTNAK